MLLTRILNSVSSSWNRILNLEYERFSHSLFLYSIQSSRYKILDSIIASKQLYFFLYNLLYSCTESCRYLYGVISSLFASNVFLNVWENATRDSVLILIFTMPDCMAFLISSSGVPDPPCNTNGTPIALISCSFSNLIWGEAPLTSKPWNVPTLTAKTSTLAIWRYCFASSGLVKFSSFISNFSVYKREASVPNLPTSPSTTTLRHLAYFATWLLIFIFSSNGNFDPSKCTMSYPAA